MAGGADVIDVKEPARGPLGRADDAVFAEVLVRVAGRRPVSAALGELCPNAVPGATPGLRYVKWGLAGWGRNDGWQEQLRNMYGLRHRAETSLRPDGECGCEVVPVANADWERAGAPPVEEVVNFVCRFGSIVLIDTFNKMPGQTLLDVLSPAAIVRLCRACRAGGVKVALAGSLRAGQMVELRAAEPDWFAVRGAACIDGRRDLPISAGRVQDLISGLA